MTLPLTTLSQSLRMLVHFYCHNTTLKKCHEQPLLSYVTSILQHRALVRPDYDLVRASGFLNKRNPQLYYNHFWYKCPQLKPNSQSSQTPLQKSTSRLDSFRHQPHTPCIVTVFFELTDGFLPASHRRNSFPGSCLSWCALMDLNDSCGSIETLEYLAFLVADVFHDVFCFGNRIHGRKLSVTFLVGSESRWRGFLC